MDFGLILVAIVGLVCVVAITAIVFGRRYYGKVSRDEVRLETGDKD